MLETIQMLCVQSSSLRWFRVVGFFFFLDGLLSYRQHVLADYFLDDY